MHTIDVYYIVVVWFLFLGITNRKYLPSSAILFIIYTFNIVATDFIGLTDDMTYIEWLDYIIKLDGATALILTMVMTIDKHAWKQALILSFAVLCHSMISLHLITDSSLLRQSSLMFYRYYDELIIMSALLQMAVSYNGMAKGLNNALRFLQGVLFRVVFHSYRIHKSLFTQKKAKANP